MRLPIHDRAAMRRFAAKANPTITLERETSPGGILYENPQGVRGTKLGDINAAWYDLLRSLQLVSDGEADNILAKLGVVRTRNKGARGHIYTLI